MHNAKILSGTSHLTLLGPGFFGSLKAREGREGGWGDGADFEEDHFLWVHFFPTQLSSVREIVCSKSSLGNQNNSNNQILF